MGIMRPLSHIRYFKAYSASLLASLLHNQVSNSQWCGVVLITSLFTAILNTGVSTRALESATSTLLCPPVYERVTFPVAFLSKSEPATSGSFSVSDEALKGRYKKS